jgi:hypothetical protein
MKQTAVEWFESMLKNWDVLLPEIKKAIIEQAKQMEKEQIVNAYLQKRTKGDISHVVKTWDKPEQYYNETFKSE